MQMPEQVRLAIDEIGRAKRFIETGRSNCAYDTLDRAQRRLEEAAAGYPLERSER